MQTRQWIKGAEGNGWRVASVAGLSISLRCSCVGCAGKMVLPLDNLGAVPPRCDLPHKSGHGQEAFGAYEGLVGELRRRRRSLGLDQGDVNAAMGMADGYVAKLESFARVATFPTLQLWASTLGLELAPRPTPLPAATLRAIEARAAAPYDHAKARFKHDG